MSDLAHIAPWTALLGLFGVAGAVLFRDCLLYPYGPYRRADVESAPSNIAFKASLLSRAGVCDRIICQKCLQTICPCGSVGGKALRHV